MKSLHIAVMLNHYIATFKPFWIAAQTLAQSSVVAYTKLTSDQAKEVYQTLWILAQAAFWLSALAAIQTIRAGQFCRRFYDAEWADDLNRLIHWLQTFPDTCIADTGTCVGEALPEANRTTATTTSAQNAQMPADTSQNVPDGQTIGTVLSTRQPRQLAALAHHFITTWQHS